MPPTPPETLTIAPPPADALGLLRARPPLTALQRDCRAALALPTDRPIIMTGHEPEFWHAGVLAKYFAADALARALEREGRPAAPASIVVDHDVQPANLLRFPVWRHDVTLHADFLDAATLAPAPVPPAGVPACATPARRVSDADRARAAGVRHATPNAREGVSRMLDALARHADATHAGAQHAAILRDLLADLHVRGQPILATALARTPYFKDILDRMARAPEACVEAYNAAVAAVPEAGVPRLLADDVQSRYELPLWRLAWGQPRRRVYAEELDTIPPEHLAPRALLMTALLRSAACDLFIHGLGGGVYDRATDLWFAKWAPDAPLAPTLVVTATRRLAFPPTLTCESPAMAAWRLHHARHDPGTLGDAPAAARKRDLVRAIDAAKTAGDDPLPHYRAMHALLDRVRVERRAEIERLDRAAALAQAVHRERPLRQDRTWSFPLHDPKTLLTLKREIDAAFGL